MNKKVGDMVPFFKSQKFQKIASGILVLLILVALPLTLYEVKQQQTVNQNAGWYVPQEQHYACGSNLTVLLDLYGETPSCPSGSLTDGSLKSYKSAVIIKAASGSSGNYTIHWKWNGYWCPNPSTGPCTQNLKTTGEQTVALTGSGTGNTTSPLWSPNMTPLGQFVGQACGAYQTDFGFYVTDSSNRTICGISLNDLGNTNNNAAFCNSRLTCTGPTSTPTPTIPVTNTPTDTPTSTPGVTITPTNTVTPTDTVTPTETITPTSGVTVTPSDSPTPTTPNQPSDTPTTVIVTTTPKPTLPPTGPSNTLVNIGIIGGIVAAAGVALILIL